MRHNVPTAMGAVYETIAAAPTDVLVCYFCLRERDLIQGPCRHGQPFSLFTPVYVETYDVVHMRISSVVENRLLSALTSTVKAHAKQDEKQRAFNDLH